MGIMPLPWRCALPTTYCCWIHWISRSGRKRGLLHYQDDNWEAASYNLRRYFYLSGQLMAAQGLPDPPESSHTVVSQVTDEQVLEIYLQIEEMRKRIN
ncbi:MAG: hypothetical protein R2932_56515 [Caldilineaceae bacterium]